MPKISICVPVHSMPDGKFFFDRLWNSIEEQTFKDFEVIVTDDGLMAENTNSAIRKAKGDIVKILFMDDFFAHPQALQMIVDNFNGGWLVTGCEHARKDGFRYNPHLPTYNHAIHTGINSIGSPSVLAFENEGYRPSKSKQPTASIPVFDNSLSWLLDCDLYKRLYTRYGEPAILNDMNVVIGVGEHQTTNTLPAEVKAAELEYMKKKYAK